MADEEFNEETDEDEDDISEEEGSEERKKRPFLAFFDIQRVLLISLQYIVIALITFGVAYWVSLRTINKKQQQNLFMSEAMQGIEPETGDYYTPIPAGFDWTMDEMIINTADQDAGHYVKTIIVVSYDKENQIILSELTARSSQIHAEVRKIIGSKQYIELQGIQKQEILTKEIKTKIQLIIGKPGIIDIFLKDFTLH